MSRSRHYLDTGIFVTPMLKNRAQPIIDACIEWQRQACAREIDAVTSYLTWDEVAHVAGRTKKGAPFDRSRSEEAGRLLLALPGLTFISLDEEVVRRAQLLLPAAGVGPRDCVHASCAILHACGQLVTLDSGFESGGGLTVTRVG